IGLTCPIEAYPQSPVPTMQAHLQRVKLAESLGFTAVWLRDVPFNVPSFGDAGQGFDPFVYLGFLAANTSSIALGVASLILPVRHPAHIAKASASVDVLSGGRLVLGVASGDRPQEYPALNIPFEQRGERFRECFDYLRQMSSNYPTFDNGFGKLNSNMDLLPKPVAGTVPLLITGGSQQSPEWAAQHGDGWMTYPRAVATQQMLIKNWNENVEAAGRPAQPVMQPLYIDLLEDPTTPLMPIHLGFRCGVRTLLDYLKSLESIGINHVALNLRFNTSDIDATMMRLADNVLVKFHG
ncbi:MAG: LLM class oxidoreductase, partial [Gammaproteobacteria bacterium]|nr:LLM class oxidoreductase [Gammaproteobacteria bacterium]